MTPRPRSCLARPHVAVVAVGSNQRRARSIAAAIQTLRAEHGTLWISRFAETAPVGMTDGSGPFLNGAIGLVTRLDRAALKARLVELELRAGRRRDRPDRRTRARPLDLDIALWFGPDDRPPAPRPMADYVAPFVDEVLALLADDADDADADEGRPIELPDGVVIGRAPTAI